MFGLLLNEISFDSKEDWVEISLPTDATSSVDLSKFRLRDSTTSNKVDLKGSLEPGGYYIAPFSNKLNNKGDAVRLFDVSGSEEILVDEISFGQGGKCPKISIVARISESDWGVASVPTKGEANKEVTPCSPIPTSIPTNIPTPVPTHGPVATQNTISIGEKNVASEVSREGEVGEATDSLVLSSDTNTEVPYPYQDIVPNETLVYSPLKLAGIVSLSLGIAVCITGVLYILYLLKKRYNKKL